MLLLLCCLLAYAAPQAGGDVRHEQPSGQLSQASWFTRNEKMAEMRIALHTVIRRMKRPIKAPRARRTCPGEIAPPGPRNGRSSSRVWSRATAAAAASAFPPDSCHFFRAELISCLITLTRVTAAHVSVLLALPRYTAFHPILFN